jgi:hypothetical protein
LILTGEREGREERNMGTSTTPQQLRKRVEELMKGKNLTMAEALRNLQSDMLLSKLEEEQRHAQSDCQRERDGAKGWARDAFARRVQGEFKTVLSQHPQMPQREAFLLAASRVAHSSPNALRDYRNDVETI